MTIDTLILAICFVLIIEGLGPLLIPNKWQLLLKDMAAQSPNVLRRIGGLLVVTGSVILWFILF